MRHKPESSVRENHMYSEKSSLTWSENPGAAGGTYRLERRSRRAQLSGQIARPARIRCFVGNAILIGAPEKLADAQTAPRLLPRKPSMVHEVPTPAVRRHLSKDEMRLREELGSYAELTDNWNGEGGVAPPKEAVRDVISFLDARPDDVRLPLPEVASVGDVGIYWDEDGIFAEVQFGGDRRYSFYAERKVAREVVEEYSRDGVAIDEGWPDDMVQLLRQLNGSQPFLK